MRSTFFPWCALVAGVLVFGPGAVADEARYRVQLAALQQRDGIGAEWRRLDEAHGDLLGALDRFILPVERDGQPTVYRLQAGPLGAADARVLCEALRARNQDCIVARAPPSAAPIPTLSVRPGPVSTPAIEAFNQGRPEEAARLFQPLAEKGDAIAQNFMGILFAHGRGVSADLAVAAGWYLKAAEQGYAAAQHNLGDAYEHGAGVPADPARAARWYRAAAKQDVASAQNALAGLYFRGEGVRRDPKEAAHWYGKAAQAGYAESQHNLGVLYFKGEGVRQDRIAAHMWWSLAARTSDPVDDLRRDAADNALRLEAFLSPEELSASRQRAARWIADHPPD